MFISKLHVTAWHLAVSGLIIAVATWFAHEDWYPAPWFVLDGGSKGIMLLAAMLLVLGPVLTFLLFDRRKSRLALGIDLGLILLLQTGALIYGSHKLHEQRPVGIVFSAGQIYTIDSSTLKRQDKSLGDLERFGNSLPVRIYARPPREPDEINDMLELFLGEGLQEHQQFNLYRPLGDAQLQDSLENSLSVNLVLESLPDSRNHIRRILEHNPGLVKEDLYFKHFIGRYLEKTIVMDAAGQILGWLPPIS